MDDFLALLSLSLIMFVSTFMIGYLPMLVKLSEKKLETISVIGAGFLLGTALIIIVPEGLTVLLEVGGIVEGHHSHSPIVITDHTHHSHAHTHLRMLLGEDHDHDHSESHSHEDVDTITHSHDPILHSIFRKMGLILSLGFIFMMVIEKYSDDHGGSHMHDHASPHQHAGHNDAHQHPHHSHSAEDILDSVEAQNLISSPGKSSSKLTKASNRFTPNPPSDMLSSHDKAGAQDSLLSFMIGLLTHAAVDGVALGAVSAEGQAQSLSIVVFIALMGHKAPAVISLAAFLKRKGRPRKEILKQLCAFSAAAPVFAILTFMILDTLFLKIMDLSLAGSEALGWCLLFSGGTFLYVVTMHMLPELKSWRPTHNFTYRDIGLLAFGAVLPSFFEHSH